MHKVKGAYRARTDWLRTYGLALLTIIFSITLIGMLIMREFEVAAVKNVKQTDKAHVAKKPALPDIDWHNMTNTPTWNLSAWNGPALVDPASPEWKGTIAICSIMKGENHADIEEWLLYHKWVGVDEIFLRENSNVVPPKLLQRIQPMIDSGFVHIDWLPGRKHPLQNRWYNRCSKPDMAGAHSWVAFVDLDEFLVPLENGMAAQNPDLKKTLAHFKDYAAVSVQWVLFGSSGHIKRPVPGGPLRHYTKCTGEFSYQMKCLANMFWSTRETMMVGDTVHDCTLRMDPDGDLNSHPVVLTDGSRARMFENTHMGNPDGWDIIGRTRSYIGHLNATLYVDHRDIRPENKLAIFHYVTRSLSEYVSRKSKLPSGIYTHTFVTSHRHSHTSLMDLDAFAEFEKSFKFDQDHPVCHSVADAKYAERARQAYEETVQQVV